MVFVVAFAVVVVTLVVVVVVVGTVVVVVVVVVVVSSVVAVVVAVVIAAVVVAPVVIRDTVTVLAMLPAEETSSSKTNGEHAVKFNKNAIVITKATHADRFFEKRVVFLFTVCSPPSFHSDS